MTTLTKKVFSWHLGTNIETAKHLEALFSTFSIVRLLQKHFFATTITTFRPLH